MFTYIGILITWLAAAAAIKGSTWDDTKSGSKKLTKTGVVSLIVMTLGFSLIIINSYHSKLESDEYKNIITQTKNNTNQINQQSKILKKQLLTAVKNNIETAAKTEKLKKQLQIYQALVDEIYDDSKRQIETVMTQSISIKSSTAWIAPDEIYGGSVIKTSGFEESLIVIYGFNKKLTGDRFNKFITALQNNKKNVDLENPYLCHDFIKYVKSRYDFDLKNCGYFFQKNKTSSNDKKYLRTLEKILRDVYGDSARLQILKPSMEQPFETAVTGIPDNPMHWAVTNLSKKTVSGKISITYTPRINSKTWSRIEETILNQNPADTQKMKVITNDLNLRENPNLNSPVLKILNQGEVLIIIEKQNQWIKVRLESSETGWVFKKYVEKIR